MWSIINSKFAPNEIKFLKWAIRIVAIVLMAWLAIFIKWVGTRI